MMPWSRCGKPRKRPTVPLIDTSVIIRYLTGDNEELTQRAAEIIENKVIYSFDKRFPREKIKVRTTFSVPASVDRSG